MTIPAWISQEPVVWTAFVGAIIAVLIAFGVPITAEQKTAVIAVVTAVLALFVRSKVTPTAAVE